MSTAFFRRPEVQPLRLDLNQPERGYLSVVLSFFKNNNLEIEFHCELVGPQHDPLWEVVPTSKQLFPHWRGWLELITLSVMGEAHEMFKISHMKKKYAMNACAHLIADSGHCVGATLAAPI